MLSHFANLGQQLLNWQVLPKLRRACDLGRFIQPPLLQGDLCFPQLESPRWKHDHALFSVVGTLRVPSASLRHTECAYYLLLRFVS